MTSHQVVVIGGGPAGMMLAAELTLAGVDVAVLERRSTTDLESPRSRGLHARTIEVLDQRGIADRFVDAGTPMQVQAFAGIPLDISDFPSRHPHGLALPQSDFERILAEWLDELSAKVQRGRSVDGVTPHEDHVAVACADGTQLRAEYLVGCDGGRSLVRNAAGIEFAGWDPTVCWIHAEVEVDEQPAFGLRGGGGIGPAEDGRIGVTLAEPDVVARFSEPSIDDVRAALIRTDGTDYGARRPRFVARFTDATRQAVTYRSGRVLLAGDAAHIHAPFGGQGLNLGVQDSVNLGWKLAQVVRGTSPDSVLDTYEMERHPVAAHVLRNTMAQRAMQADGERSAALRDVVADLLTADDARIRLAATIAGLDIDHEPDAGHPLIGRRMPDVDLETNAGPTSVYEHLRRAEWLLVTFGDRAEPTLAIDAPLRRVRSTATDDWRLPVLGAVDPPSVVLVRPDGYVAWAGADPSDGLDFAAAKWFSGADADDE